MKNNKKGFTLVELIVVLVILAIMLAILVPTLTGYIDKANELSSKAEARQLYIAAQAVVSETYGTGTPVGDATWTNGTNTGAGAKVLPLSELTAADYTSWSVTIDDNKVTSLTYVDNDGYTATFTGGVWSASKTA